MVQKQISANLSLVKRDNKTTVENTEFNLLDMGSEIFLLKTLLFTANKNTEVIKKIFYDVSEDDFIDYRFRNLYIAIMHCFEKTGYIDIVEIFKMSKNKSVNYIGIDENLLKLINNAIFNVSAIDIDRHIKNIKENSRRHRFIRELRTAIEMLNSSTVNDVSLSVYGYIKKNIIPYLSSDMSDGLSTTQIIERFIDMQASGNLSSNGIETGFEKIDAITTGFRKGEYTVIAGRPSLGKTAFALTSAIEQSKKYNVLFFSSEMSESSLGERLISMFTGKNIKQIRKEGINEIDISSLKAKENEYKNVSLQFIFNVRSIEEIQKHVFKRIEKVGIDIIYIDYLQLLVSDKINKNIIDRNKEITMISQAIKYIATSNNVAVVVLSQLNRNIERENRSPKLSDLRDSGSIEADADLICFLHRDNYTAHVSNTTDKSAQNNNINNINNIIPVTEFIIAKGRNVGTGKVDLYWSPDFMTFSE